MVNLTISGLNNWLKVNGKDYVVELDSEYSVQFESKYRITLKAINPNNPTKSVTKFRLSDMYEWIEANFDMSEPYTCDGHVLVFS